MTPSVPTTEPRETPAASPPTDPYAGIAAAMARWSSATGDASAGLVLAREYARMGLARPARELLDVLRGRAARQAARAVEDAAAEGSAPPWRSGAQAGMEGEYDRLDRSLSRLPDGRVPWSRHSTRLDANLAALARRGVEIEPIRRAWRSSFRRFELYRDALGNEQARFRGDDGEWRWIPRVADHRLEAERQPGPADISHHFPGPYLFAGLGLGHWFERMAERTRNTFLGFSCALYVVERDAAKLAMVLHLRDWAALLGEERIFLFVGSDALERFAGTLRRDGDLAVPTHAFAPGDPAELRGRSAVDVAREALEERESEAVRSAEQLRAQYAGRDAVFWARRFDEALSGEGAPLRILAAVSVHTTFLQHSMRDSQRAFEALGHSCEVLKERRPFEVVGLSTYHEAIRRLDPDLFFNLDHVRPEFGMILPENLPVLTWDQDQLPHVFTRENSRQVARHDFLVGCSKTRWILLGGDPRQFLPAIVPTCPEQFSGEPLTEEEAERYTCDVSYVSHASQTPEAFHEEEKTKARDPRLARLLEEMYAITRSELPGARTMHISLPRLILQEASRRTGVGVDEAGAQQLCGWYLWRLGDRIFRHEALEWVAAWARRTGRTLRIHGNGWEHHPTLSGFAAGPVENGRELLCVYRASRINLQLMPAGFIHQRALDGLAAGGFFLTRRVPHDLMSAVLRRLLARVDTLGLKSKGELLACEDAEVRGLLRAYCGRGLEAVDPQDGTFLDNLRMVAELPHPDEAFPGFAEIVFDSAEEFERAAERFLADAGLRHSFATRMREVVIERFSYQAQMDRFLRAMCGYLREARR